MESPSPSKVEVIKQAIKQVMEEVGDCTKSSSSSNDNGDVEDDDHHRRGLLSKLMSQVESLGDGLADPEISKSESTTDESKLKGDEEEEKERIVKELKKLKRQNRITHFLLSAMIVLTVTWQISEVSLIMKLKEGIRHPFRSVGSIFMGMLKPPKLNGNEDETEPPITSSLIESSPIHDVKIPHVELPKIDWSFDNEGIVP